MQTTESIVIVFLTVPAEAREQALEVLSLESIDGFPGSVANPAASFIESENAETRESDVLSVAARTSAAPSPQIAERLWRAVEATLFRGGVTAVEHMAAYAIPGM